MHVVGVEALELRNLIKIEPVQVVVNDQDAVQRDCAGRLASKVPVVFDFST